MKHHHGGLRAMVLVLGFSGIIFLAELIGGLVSGSLALVADAMHMLSDSLGLLVAIAAVIIGRRGATSSATYGFRRVEVLAALVNALSVALISLWIVWEAISRLGSGETINVPVMLGVGTIGLIANVFGALVLHGHAHDNMNVRGAYLHVLADLLGSIVVIVAAIAMWLWGITWVDMVASMVIATLIVPRSLKLANSAVRVLLEQAPRDVDADRVVVDLLSLPEVESVHDMHLWSLDGKELLGTCHLVVSVPLGECGLLDRVQGIFAAHGVGHSTVQLESAEHGDHEHRCHTH